MKNEKAPWKVTNKVINENIETRKSNPKLGNAPQ